jgi:hypothetical protein
MAHPGLAAFLLLALLPATAGASMHCGNHLVREGDTADRLLTHCGRPTDVETRTALRPPVIWMHGRPIHVPGGEIEMRVEYWTYNLGPNKLMRRIRIEDGIIRQFETLGYGYHAR